MGIAQRGMAFLIKEAKRQLDLQQLSLLLQDRPEYHAPKWHVHGVLGHIYNVIVAAERLGHLTSVDIVNAAIFHDIGKIHQFPRALKAFESGQDGSIKYLAHEQLSATIAARNRLNRNDCAIIGSHQHAYDQARVTTILKKIGCEPGKSPAMFKRWMVLCAADAVGKGFTPEQAKQRPFIAMKFREVADVIGLRIDDRVLSTCCEAAEFWEPIPREQLPKFR